MNITQALNVALPELPAKLMSERPPRMHPDVVFKEHIDEGKRVIRAYVPGVDALFTGDPVATAAIRTGIAELISNIVECPKYIQDPFPFGSFNISKTWADGHPDEFMRLVAAIDEAAQYVNQHPDEAKQAMASYLPEQFRTDAQSYPNARYLLTDQSTQAMYQDLAERYLKMGIVNQPVSLTGLVVTKR